MLWRPKKMHLLQSSSLRPICAGDRGVTVEALQLSDIESMDEEAKGDPVAAVTDTNAFDESNSDDDEHINIDKGNIDKGNDKGNEKGNDNDDDTDSEFDMDTTLSNLA
jgi:hypothetical protein